MATRHELLDEIAFFQTFKGVVQGFEEVSTLKMKKIRSSVVQTRDFLTRLSHVYFQVKAANQKKIDRLLAADNKKKKKKGRGKAPLVLEKKKQPLYVFLSANTKLYGEIIAKVFDNFQEALAKAGDKADVMIIGRVGRTMYKEAGLTRPYLYFEIPDLDARPQDLRQVAFHLVQYEHVVVFHGKFDSILTQNAQRSSVTGDLFIEGGGQAGGAKREVAMDFLFEPNLEEIVRFFETQVSTLLLNQVVNEGALARFASRIRAMEKALERTNEIEYDLNLKKRLLKKSTENKKQTEKMAGFSLWGK